MGKKPVNIWGCQRQLSEKERKDMILGERAYRKDTKAKKAFKRLKNLVEVEKKRIIRRQNQGILEEDPFETDYSSLDIEI